MLNTCSICVLCPGASRRAKTTISISRAAAAALGFFPREEEEEEEEEDWEDMMS